MLAVASRMQPGGTMTTIPTESLMSISGGGARSFNPRAPGLIHQMISSPMGSAMRVFSSANAAPVGARVLVNGADGISTRMGTVEFRPYGGNRINFGR